MSGGPRGDIGVASVSVGSSDAMAAIAAYADGCRRRIPEFAREHFTLTRAWERQRRTLGRDLLVGPVNAVWAVPYLAFARVCRSLDTLGVPGAAWALRVVPRGIRSGYQRAVEHLIATHLLGCEDGSGHGRLPQALVRELADRVSTRHLAALEQAVDADVFRIPLDQVAVSRELLADLTGSAVTVWLGWLAFDSPSLGLGGMSEQFARRSARSRAASNFFLGRRAGSVFYAVFRPDASRLETTLIFVGLAAFVGAVVIAAGVLFEPLRQRLGLHERRLVLLVDTIERDLTLRAHKALSVS